MRKAQVMYTSMTAIATLTAMAASRVVLEAIAGEMYPVSPSRTVPISPNPAFRAS